MPLITSPIQVMITEETLIVGKLISIVWHYHWCYNILIFDAVDTEILLSVFLSPTIITESSNNTHQYL